MNDIEIFSQGRKKLKNNNTERKAQKLHKKQRNDNEKKTKIKELYNKELKAYPSCLRQLIGNYEC